MAIIDNAPEANDLLPYIHTLGCTTSDIDKALTNPWIVDRANKRGTNLDHVRDTMMESIRQTVDA